MGSDSSASSDASKPKASPSSEGSTSQTSMGSGLRRTTSRPNMLNHAVSNSGGLGLRRTGSKMSLSDLAGAAKKPATQVTASQPRPSYGQEPTPELPRAATKNTNAPENKQNVPYSQPATNHEPSENVIPSPPISPGLPRLHRSRSMNNFDTLKAPAVSEGQKAVEQISGKVELPQFGQNVRPSAVPAHMAQNEVTERGSIVQPGAPSYTSSPTNSGSVSSGSGSKSSEAPESTPQTSTLQTSSSSARPQPGPPASSGSSTSSEIAPAALLTAVNHMAPGHSPRDDGDLKPEAESRVDYFSHDWNEADIAGSWRYIISRRQDMANSARLENASWRMWAKAKNNLRTISPSTVNWLKDYDVTWLYGPLYHEPDNVYVRTPGSRLGSTPGTPDAVACSSSGSSAASSNPSSSTSSSRRLASLYEQRSAAHSSGFYPKSILKKKTLAQLMLEEAQELEQNTNPQSRSSSHTRSTANYLRHHHYRPTPQGQSRQAVANILNRQYHSVPPTQNFESGSTETADRAASSAASSAAAGATSGAASGAVSGANSPMSKAALNDLAASVQAASLQSSRTNSRSSSMASSRASSRQGSQLSFRTRPGSLLSLRSSYSSSYERRVHFNDRVEQCIALDPDAEGAEAARASQRPNLGHTSESQLAGSSRNPLSDSEMSAEEEDSESSDEDEDADDDEDNGGGLFLGLRRPSMLDLHPEGEKPRIIAALPATTLKLEEFDNDEGEGHEEAMQEVSEDPVFGSRSRRPGFNAQYVPQAVQSYEIVDPEIHPVKFEAKGVPKKTKESHQQHTAASLA